MKMIEKKYKGGFVVHGEHPILNVEWLLSQPDSNDGKLVFQAYDANLWPLPDFSTWGSKEHKDKQIAKALAFTEGFAGEVWLDDVKIK